MNRQEHLLICLAEECSEVGQRVSKCLRFGLNEKQKGQDYNNRERLEQEIKDMLCVINILLNEGMIKNEGCYPNDISIFVKKSKIEKYMEISKEQGVLK